MKPNLSLYLHIPFCVRKCLYCDFLSGPQSADVQEQYVEALCHEIQETSPEYREFQVVSVFIGGGTPSVLQPEQTIRIMETVKHCFALTDTCEISMEMNPGTVTSEKMKAYRACGINRISIGLQSANDEELKAIGRIHTYADFLKAYEMAVEAGFTNINVDLMSAIPEQTLDSYQETLQKVLALQPQPTHISAYSLIVEEGTPFYEQELNLPDEETERRMYEITDDILRKAGYHRYEISNYAKEGKECFHNKVYWQRGNYLGLGIGSASLIQNVRFHNVTDLSSYVNLMLGKNEIEDASKERGEQFHAEKDYLKKGNVEKDYLKKENAEKEQAEKLIAEKEQVEKVNEKIEYVRKGNIEKECVEESGTEKNNMGSRGIACPDTNIAERLKRLREEVQELPVGEQMEEFMFLGLRMMEGVSERKFYENFDRRFEEVFPGMIEKHEKLGLLEVTGEEEEKQFVRLRLTPHGIDVSNQVFVDFML